MGEGTVTISIINEALRDEKLLDKPKRGLVKCPKCGEKLNKVIDFENDVSFTCFLSFLSKRDDTYLPPFLPAFNFFTSRY